MNTLIKPICVGCNKHPDQIPEYTDREVIGRMTPDQYVATEEGTYNRENGRFWCTECYVRAGMPSSPMGWTAP